MIELTERAYAKLNLSLDIVGRRADGYHDLKMVMQTVDLHDDVRLRISGRGGWRIRGSGLPMPLDETNLAWKAAEAYFSGMDQRPGLEIRIDKRIPSQAGLGGGSADAAAVLRALNREYQIYRESELMELALQIGSDVPYCMVGGTKLAEGRGEILTELPPLPDCRILIVKPIGSVSTAELFHAIDEDSEPTRRWVQTTLTDNLLTALQDGNLYAIGQRLSNVFEPFAMKKCREIELVLVALRECSGNLGIAMTGTGSACYALFKDENAAGDARTRLGSKYTTFLTKPV